MSDKKEDVIVYVDGFNLYYGLKEKSWEKYLWLDICSLSHKLLRPNQVLKSAKYFTARVSGTKRDPDKIKRQNTYLEALETIDKIQIYYGSFLRKPINCYKCNRTLHIPEEKKTDVNIATELMSDAHQNVFDVAILISADSDLSPPLEKIKKLFPLKKTIIAFPPKRYSVILQKCADATLYITRSHLSKSQFPQTVTKPDGFVLSKPSSWT